MLELVPHIITLGFSGPVFLTLVTSIRVLTHCLFVRFDHVPVLLHDWIFSDWLVLLWLVWSLRSWNFFLFLFFLRIFNLWFWVNFGELTLAVAGLLCVFHANLPILLISANPLQIYIEGLAQIRRFPSFAYYRLKLSLFSDNLWHRSLLFSRSHLLWSLSLK